MFSIIEIFKRGWWNTSVIVSADEEIILEEKRLRYSGLRVARVETWRLRIEPGDTFRIHLPTSVGAKLGDKLSVETIKTDLALQTRWNKVQCF